MIWPLSLPMKNPVLKLQVRDGAVAREKLRDRMRRCGTETYSSPTTPCARR
jgi:hypothetical protein